MNFKSLISLFHRHVHNKLCQVMLLGTYLHGMGLEDLEGCECLFAKLNALAAWLQYASIFHQRQAIACYFNHLNSYETFESLSEWSLFSIVCFERFTHRHILEQQLQAGCGDPSRCFQPS